MVKRYRLLVFDWEGTLGEDTIGQVIKAIRESAVRLGLGEVDQALAQKSVYLGLIKAIHRLFPNARLHQQEALFSAVNSSLAKSSVAINLIHGAFDVVERAFNAGYLLAVATNKSQQSLNKALQASGLGRYFLVNRCAGHVPAKPCPQMLQELMDVFDVRPEETLMIGDSLSDMEMAQTLSVDALGIDIHQLNTIELLTAGAQMVCVDYSQVADFLQL